MVPRFLALNRRAALLENGIKFFLDAGSTTDEVVRVLCRRIETRALRKITIATTSVKIACVISDCCVAMGFADDFSAVRLYIPGGQIRPNTQAIVAAYDSEPSHIARLAESLGGFDLGILGVNGIDAQGGFTKHGNLESRNKSEVIRVSTTSVIVGDTSKLGIVLPSKFAELTDDVQLIIDDDPANAAPQDLLTLCGSNISLA